MQCGGHEFTRFGCFVEPQSKGRGMPPVALDMVASAFKKTVLACPRSPSMFALGMGIWCLCFLRLSVAGGGLAILIFFTNTPPLVSLC